VLVAACSSQVPPSTAGGTCTDYVIQAAHPSGVTDAGTAPDASSSSLCINLPPSDAGPIQCTLLATLKVPGSESTCATLGVPTPASNTLTQFRAQQESAWQSMGGAASGQPDPSKLPVCVVPQLTGSDLDPNGSCAVASKPGFCLLTGSATPNCGIAEVVLSPSGWLDGALITIDCRNGC
jgi:hypothetical protein